ncbi:MAG: glycosyltransferase [Mucilaginibacter sp.]|nr:glycosyltransferase [Mucilaginibacter sp.]
MNVYIVCAWYEVAMRHYSFTILNNIRQYLPPEYKINVTLVLRNNKENYTELKELEGLNIDYLIIKNKYLNIASKVFPFFFDKYVAKKAKEYNASLIYILFEGLFFNNIKGMQKQCKVLFTVHDLIPHEKNIVNWKEKWLAETESKRGKYLRENADYTITNAYSQFIMLKSMFNKPTFYTSMPTLVNDHIANGKLKPAELDINNYILFFGRIDKYKGLDQLIKCHLDSGVSTILVIAGAGNLWFKIPDNRGVVFINRYIDDEEFNYLFANALMTVLPYKASTQTSLVSIPYYFKCPVMLSDITEFKLLAANSGSIICDFNNPDQYSKQVEDITRDVAYKEEIIAKQSKFYSENYNSENFVTNLKKIFDEIQQEI